MSSPAPVLGPADLVRHRAAAAAPPDAVPPARRGRRRRAVPPARRGPAGHRLHYAVKANPEPHAARRAGRGRQPVRRGQPGGGARGARRRAPAARPRLLQPGQAARRHRVRRRARGPAVRRRHARGDRQGRRRRARGRRSSAGWSPRARARTGRCRASTAARPTRRSRCCGTPRRLGLDAGRGLLPRRVAAARPGGVGGAHRRERAGCSRRSGPAGSRPRLLDLGGGFPAQPGGGLPAAGGVRRRHRAAPATSTSADAPPRHARRARPRHRRRRRRAGRRGARGRPPRRHPLGVPRRGRLHRPGRDARRGDPLPDRDRPRRRPDRPLRAGRPDLRQRRRALRAGQVDLPLDLAEGDTGPAAGGRGLHQLLLDRRASTASRRCRPTSCREPPASRSAASSPRTPRPRSRCRCRGRCCSCSRGTEYGDGPTGRWSSGSPGPRGCCPTCCCPGRSARWATGSAGSACCAATLRLRVAFLAVVAVAVPAGAARVAVVAAALAVACGTPAYPTVMAAIPRLAGPPGGAPPSALVTIEVAAWVVGPRSAGCCSCRRPGRSSRLLAVLLTCAAGLAWGVPCPAR